MVARGIKMKYEILETETVLCPLCKVTTKLCRTEVMGDYRYNRKRCSRCLLFFEGKEWKKRILRL